MSHIYRFVSNELALIVYSNLLMKEGVILKLHGGDTLRVVSVIESRYPLNKKRYPQRTKCYELLTEKVENET